MDNPTGRAPVADFYPPIDAAALAAFLNQCRGSMSVLDATVEIVVPGAMPPFLRVWVERYTRPDALPSMVATDAR